jgi:hypothetical protein
MRILRVPLPINPFRCVGDIPYLPTDTQTRPLADLKLPAHQFCSRLPFRLDRGNFFSSIESYLLKAQVSVDTPLFSEHGNSKCKGLKFPNCRVQPIAS